MKKNILLLFTLVASILFARLVGDFISFEGKTLKVNQKIKDRIIQALTSETTQSSTSSIQSIEPTSVSHTQAAGNIESLARCLDDGNFTMYGTPDCPACAIQRDYFGQYFPLVSYVDCYQEKNLCQSKNITGYPTWEDSLGQRYKGAIPLKILAQLSGCPLPE